MKIRIDAMYKKVYTVENDQTGSFWFNFQNKKDLLEQLKEEKPGLKANCNCLYGTIEERFNNI